MPKREEGIPRSQEEEEEEGAPPEQRALLAHGMQGRGGPQNPTNAPGRPPEQRAHPTHGMQGREEGIPRSQEEEEEDGHSLMSVHYQLTACRNWGAPRPKPTTRGDPLSSMRPK